MTAKKSINIAGQELGGPSGGAEELLNAINPPRRYDPVNSSGWRFRCPHGHAKLRWSSESTVYCGSCVGDRESTYPTAVIEDAKTGMGLDDIVNGLAEVMV